MVKHFYPKKMVFALKASNDIARLTKRDCFASLAMTFLVSRSNLLLLILIIFFHAEIAYSNTFSEDTAIELFTRANGEYENVIKSASGGSEPAAQDGFIRASQLYEEILASGFKNGQIYYNLGNAYYRQGKLGYAILNYRRAQKLMPRNEDLKANLKLVKAEVKVREKKNDVPRVIQALLFWYFMLNVNEATVLAMSFYLIFSASVLLLIFFRASWLKKLCIAFGICLILTTASLVIKICPHRGVEGVIIAETCKLRYGPGEEYETKLEIHEGTEILIKQETKDWLKAYVYVDIAQFGDIKGESEKKESEAFKTGWLPLDKVGKI